MPGCPLRNTFVQPAWLTGRPRSRSKARRPNSRPDSWWDRVFPVGASLLAKAVVQLHGCSTCCPHREQARSHRFFVSCPDAVNTRNPLCWAWMLCLLKIECGSEPARDGGGSATWMFDLLPSSRAGSLPQVFCVVSRRCEHPKPFVGASLLAMAVVQLHGCSTCCPHREQARSHRFFVSCPDAVNTRNPLCWAWMLSLLKIECGSEPARDAVVAVTRPRSFYQA
ncbi:hypothetical protein SRABI06_02564 [Pseudomonas brassicacearum]|nr:hypothetical protein SRABI06_02564 [Pseudomonas brassicacearum]